MNSAHAHLFLVAFGAASLVLMSATAPSRAHETGESRYPTPPCGDFYERHMERGMHRHGMMDEGYGMGPGPAYGDMRRGFMMAPDADRGGMGRGMMMGPGAYGMDGEPGRPLRSDLSTDEIRHMMEHEVEWMGNPNLKLGKVEETDDGVVAEIVTQDGSLVQRLEIDPHTGRTRPVR